MLHKTIIAANFAAFAFMGIAAAPAQDDPASSDEIRPIDYRSGIHFDAEQPSKLIVREVAPGSPADRARIQPGDTLILVDDQPFAAAEEVETYLTTLHGTPATVIVLRDGRERALVYVNEVADVETVPVPVPKYGQPAGIGVRIRGDDDPLVLAVWEGSPANHAGILPGDRLIAVDGLELDGTDAFVAAIATHKAGESFELTIRRNDLEEIVTLEPERWTLAFDDEPQYLEGEREGFERQRQRCYDLGLGSEFALYDRDVVLEQERLTEEVKQLRLELEAVRTELAEANARLSKLKVAAED